MDVLSQKILEVRVVHISEVVKPFSEIVDVQDVAQNLAVVYKLPQVSPVEKKLEVAEARGLLLEFVCEDISFLQRLVLVFLLTVERRLRIYRVVGELEVGPTKLASIYPKEYLLLELHNKAYSPLSLSLPVLQNYADRLYALVVVVLQVHFVELEFLFESPLLLIPGVSGAILTVPGSARPSSRF